MLPKPIKSKKIKSEQLDLVEEISEKNHTRKKQLYLYISLILTIGLSLIFYTFKHFRLPKISIPTPVISDIFSLDLDNTWSVYIQSADFIYNHNFSSATSEGINYLNTSNPIDDSLLYQKIPRGVIVRQFEQKDKNKFQAYYRLTVPKRDIYILINISGDNLDQSINEIPAMVEKIYWHLVGK